MIASSEDSTIAANLALARSARVRSLMSCAKHETPEIPPTASRIGEIVTHVSTSVPSRLMSRLSNVTRLTGERGVDVTAVL